jgi:hypothetical protein
MTNRQIIVAALAGMVGGVLAGLLPSMAADWYVASGKPQQRAALVSGDLRSEFSAIQSSIADKLPALSGNGTELVRVNAGATGLEAFVDRGSFAAPFSDACTTTPTATFDYSHVGHVVVVQLAATGGACTGDSVNYQTASGVLPVDLRPLYKVQSGPMAGFLDNSTGVQAALSLYPDGTISFQVSTGSAFTIWTAAGVRQAPSQLTFAYVL